MILSYDVFVLYICSRHMHTPVSLWGDLFLAHTFSYVSLAGLPDWCIVRWVALLLRCLILSLLLHAMDIVTSCHIWLGFSGWLWASCMVRQKHILHLECGGLDLNRWLCLNRYNDNPIRYYSQLDSAGIT